MAEFTTPFAIETAREARRVGMDSIVLMPAIVFSAKAHESAAYFRGVASGVDLPVMVFNDLSTHKNDIKPDILASLADMDNIDCFRESSGDTRRFIDLRRQVGERFVLFAVLDDVVVESVAMGAVGRVSGISNAFPR